MVTSETSLREDARAISERWLGGLSMGVLTRERLSELEFGEGLVDLVALGKASREMHDAAEAVLGDRVARSLVVSDVGEHATSPRSTVLVAEHPVPGRGSAVAGEALTDFLEAGSRDTSTLFLISGGASSLCVKSAPPLGLDDVADLWSSALGAGLDITGLNQIRAATSLIGGGAVLRWVRSARTASLILVDNVTSGARWVASALTYEYAPSREAVDELCSPLALSSQLRHKLHAGFEARAALMATRGVDAHDNVVLAEPAMMLDWALAEASAREYAVIDLGARVVGDVASVARQWGEVVRNAGPRSAVIGVGELTVQVSGAGMGGRCQEFAWRMAKELDGCPDSWTFLARSSDGRDFIPGVAGAWVNDQTMRRVTESGLEWEVVARTHNTFPALRQLGHLLDGVHTGWNLCDIFVALRE